MPASALPQRVHAQLSIGLDDERPGADERPEDVRPPRPAGRLAHAVCALVTAERPDALDTADDARAAVHAALAALGAAPVGDGGGDQEVDVNEERTAAWVRTLRGPLRTLRDQGRALSFDEPLALATDGAVIEVVADLVARGAEDTLVVQWRASPSPARREAAWAEARVAAAALQQQGHPGPLRIAVWGIGELQPSPSQPWGRVAQRELAALLARLGGLDDNGGRDAGGRSTGLPGLVDGRRTT